jgi:phosphoglycerate dehydrogenase-like enzyme
MKVPVSWRDTTSHSEFAVNVHVLELPYGHSVEALAGMLAPSIRLTAGADVAPDCDILVGGRPSRCQMQVSSRFRALIIPWAGVPVPTRALALEFPQVTVHNLHHNAVPVAEMAIALLLAAAKWVIPSDRTFRAGDWSARFHQPDPGLVVQGKTALILGFGAIGQHVATLCRGLGMGVQVIRRHSPPADSDHMRDAIPWHLPSELPRWLPVANFVIVCLPLTPETNRLVGARELRLLPPQAILINVSRAEIVDEAALYHALRDGTLYAAGLDVWYTNPGDEREAVGLAPSAFPFAELENVVMSPHRAGHAAEAEQLRLQHLADLLNAAARGEPMPNKVDVRAGY